jgi:hypothetical protein
MVISLQPGSDSIIPFIIVGLLAVMIMVAAALITNKIQKKNNFLKGEIKSLTFLTSAWIINLR